MSSSCRIVLPRQGLQRACICLSSVLLSVLLGHAAAEARAATPPAIAAASSLRQLWPALESHCIARGAPRPQVSFASSGLLANQLANGAPHELFLAADKASIDKLIEAGHLSPPALHYASGHPVLVIAQQQSTRAPWAELEQLDAGSVLATLRHDTSLRLAIPNPRHAPYGRAAMQLLEALDSEDLGRQQLAMAENAAQALQYVLTGAADIGIVPEALAISQPQLLIIDAANATARVEHYLAARQSDNADINAWIACITAPDSAALLARHGFASPR